jgi:pilus assembly protein CpaB
MALYNEEGPSKPLSQRRESGARRARGKATIFMIIALGSGLSAAWLVTRYVARHSQRTEAVALTRVVVANADLPIATQLKPEMVHVVDWPESSHPQGAFTDVAALDGRVTSMAMVAGEPLVEGRLAPKGSGAGMGALIPANSRAMTVHVNDVIGVSGFIHPGDLVDVITTMQTPATKHPGVPAERLQQDEYRSKIVLQNIRVLAVGEQLATQAPDRKPENATAVTLLVNPEQSERLALASTQGKLQLTMRSPLDNGEQETPGVSPPELLASDTALAAAAPPPAPPDPGASHHHHHAPPAQVAVADNTAPQPAKPEVEVVEVLHGDRVEERKVSAKEGQR